MGIDITERYNLPFESEFDWRVQFLSLFKDFSSEAALEVIQQYEEESVDLEWKDDDGIMAFATEHGLFDKINDIVKKKAAEINY